MLVPFGFRTVSYGVKTPDALTRAARLATLHDIPQLPLGYSTIPNCCWILNSIIFQFA